MRKRTPSEIKAYGDGYDEAYRQFCHLLDRHEKETAVRKMKIFADAVALTVETATDTADTPQTEEPYIDIETGILHWCGWEYKRIEKDEPQTEQPTALSNALKEFEKDAEWLEQVGASSISLEEYKQRTSAILKRVDYKADTPQTDCGWK